jgi:hypothetical protein
VLTAHSISLSSRHAVGESLLAMLKVVDDDEDEAAEKKR